MPPPQAVSDLARRYTEDQRGLSRAALVVTDVAARRINGDPEQWRAAVTEAGPDLLSLQGAAITVAEPYVAATVAAQDTRPGPDVRVVSSAFVDSTDGGGSWLRNLVYAPQSAYRKALTGGTGDSAARARARFVARAVVLDGMRDMARSALTTAMFAEPSVTWYTRILRGISCARCAVLAGRKYRVSAFRRHPRCDCFMAPAVGDADGWTTDPMDYFRGLSGATQDAVFTTAGARAIREGADISQVVNAYDGVTTVLGFRTTTSGVTSRGLAGQRLAGSPRLLPDEIFRLSEQRGWSRAETLSELSRNGYII